MCLHRPHFIQMCMCVSADYPKPSLIFILAFSKANLVLFGESIACGFSPLSTYTHTQLFEMGYASLLIGQVFF